MFDLILNLFTIMIHFSKIILIAIAFIAILILISMQKLKYQHRYKKRTVSFIHPKCADCGGGEKVLWLMVKSLLDYNSTNPNTSIKINIICSVKDTASSMLNSLYTKFGIDLTSHQSNFVNDVELVRVKCSALEPSPYLTMLFQIINQFVFAYDILTNVHSDVFIDTTGLPFTYPLLKLFGKTVIAYVHYPFISHTMINDVRANVGGMHSRGALSKFKKAKILYYEIMLFLYKICGKCVTYAMANSTWTYNHMVKCWSGNEIDKVFPPCQTMKYQGCAQNNNRNNVIVSFAQFRPEKNHMMQLRIMKKLLEKGINVELHMIGGVRNEEDIKLVDNLQNAIMSMGLSNNVKIIKNASLDVIKSEFEKAKIGIHTMKDEHFGISIIEMMAAGLIVVAHNSAGAKEDIIAPHKGVVCGYVAENEDHYVSIILNILSTYEKIDPVKQNAVIRADSFSDEAFEAVCQKDIKKMCII